MSTTTTTPTDSTTSTTMNHTTTPTIPTIPTTTTQKKKVIPDQAEDDSLNEKYVRPSIAVKLIRHAESRNNQLYRDARFIYRGGTPEFDSIGWNHYIRQHRSADPSISDLGIEQANLLANNYLLPHLYNQASHPVRFIISPMKRTIETIRPTIEGLIKLKQQQQQAQNDVSPSQAPPVCDVTINGFYFESEGCHMHNVPQDGMTPQQTYEHMFENILSTSSSSETGCTDSNTATPPAAAVTTTTSPTTPSTDRSKMKDETLKEYCNFQCVGFPDPNKGWYCNGLKNESRYESEIRASKFYCWLCDYLDEQLLESASVTETTSASPASDNITKQSNTVSNNGTTIPNQQPHHTDLFDAGVSVAGEEHEDEHDKSSIRLRRRRTAILVGHGDFMSLLLQRIVTGFGHTVETQGIPHRSAFVHWNTGITELEYFGHGRFLVMSQNNTPHFPVAQYNVYRSGGSLKDGWSYIMPNDTFVLDAEVSVAFADEVLPQHVQEQTRALKSLYLSSKSYRPDELLLYQTGTSNNSSPTAKEQPPSNNNSGLILSVEDEEDDNNNDYYHPLNDVDVNHSSTTLTTPRGESSQSHIKHFIVKRGYQVVGVATYCDQTNLMYDVAIRPSAGSDVGTLLFQTIQQYSKQLGRSGSLHVLTRLGTDESEQYLLQNIEGLQPYDPQQQKSKL